MQSCRAAKHCRCSCATTARLVFRKKNRKYFCDRSTLRFSVWNNGDYLFAQAILWTDDDASLGKTADNREIGDWSVLILDLDADGKSTKDVDRDYDLNPWPGTEGLQYQIELGPRSTTGIRDDSKGRGAIRYLITVRWKTCSRGHLLDSTCGIITPVGDKTPAGVLGKFSPSRRLTVNSAGYEPDGQRLLQSPYSPLRSITNMF